MLSAERRAQIATEVVAVVAMREAAAAAGEDPSSEEEEEPDSGEEEGELMEVEEAVIGAGGELAGATEEGGDTIRLLSWEEAEK